MDQCTAIFSNQSDLEAIHPISQPVGKIPGRGRQCNVPLASGTSIWGEPNPLQLKIEPYQHELVTHPLIKTHFQLNTIDLSITNKKRAKKYKEKRKKSVRVKKIRQKKKIEGKKFILEQIKEKIDDSIKEVRCLVDNSIINFDLVFQQQFRAPQLKEDWFDWGLQQGKQQKATNAGACTKADDVPAETVEYPMFTTQKEIIQILRVMFATPVQSPAFGPPVLILKKEFFCDMCDWNDIDMTDYDTVKSRIMHYQRTHSKYLCENCGIAEKNTHRIAAHRKANLCDGNKKLIYEKLNQEHCNTIDTFLQTISREEKYCSVCNQYQKITATNKTKIAQHLLLSHGEFRMSDAKFYQMNLEQAFLDLSDADLTTLCVENFIIINQQGSFEKYCDAQVGDNQLMLMTYQGKLRVAVAYFIQIEEQSRIAVVYKMWTARQYFLDLAIALTELKFRVEAKRIGKMYLIACKESYWYWKRMHFEKLNDDKGKELIKLFVSDQSSHELLSIHTKQYIQSYIPAAKTPVTERKSKKAELLRIFIHQLKFNGIESLLQKYQELQTNAKGKRNNNKAQKSDQAITPKDIFKEIYERIGVHPYQMFDVCKYQQDWDSKIHFNALTESWPGNFIFVNPPFSVGSWFVTKIFSEYLGGKNIIVILPEISTECSFGSMLFRMLGSVHQLGIIKFVSHERKLRSPVSLILLIQPDHIDYLKHLKNNRKLDDQSMLLRGENTIKTGKAMRKEKLECASKLLQQQLTVREIRQCVGVSYTSIAQLRKNQSANGNLRLMPIDEEGPKKKEKK